MAIVVEPFSHGQNGDLRSHLPWKIINTSGNTRECHGLNRLAACLMLGNFLIIEGVWYCDISLIYEVNVATIKSKVATKRIN
jgi:hypothetical protein